MNVGHLSRDGRIVFQEAQGGWRNRPTACPQCRARLQRVAQRCGQA